MLISVVGGDTAPPDVLAQAEELGRELARRGCTVVCGGRSGVMETVCRGAREAGGHTIGILPGVDRHDMNPYVEFPILTGMGYARNVAVVLSGEAVIAVDGSYGTLSEIAHALAHGKPVIGLHTWSFSNENTDDRAIIRASDPQDAVEKAIAAARARPDGRPQTGARPGPSGRQP
jgi:uncharacterized protein (TIGR00725 family)